MANDQCSLKIWIIYRMFHYSFDWHMDTKRMRQAEVCMPSQQASDIWCNSQVLLKCIQISPRLPPKHLVHWASALCFSLISIPYCFFRKASRQNATTITTTELQLQIIITNRVESSFRVLVRDSTAKFQPRIRRSLVSVQTTFEAL